MNNHPNSLSDHNSSRIAADNMSVSAAATNFSQVLRMPALQQFHSLPSLTLSSYGSVNEAMQGTYFYHDNGFGAPISTSSCIKEEKSTESTGERSHSQIDVKPSLNELQSRLNASSPKSSSDSYNEMDVVDGKQLEMKMESDVDMKMESDVDMKMESEVDEPNVAVQSGLIGRNYHPQHSTLTISANKMVNNTATNIMLAHSPMISTNHIRYPPNGDALLSASAVGYGDNEMLPESGFNVVVSNSLGSLLGSSGNGNFDFFDGEGRNEPYSQDLQLSPAQFSNSAENYGLNESSNHEQQIMEDNGRNEDLSIMKVSGNGKRKPNVKNVNTNVNRVKNKIKAVKSGSLNRTGTLPCPVCSKVFSNSSALAKHKLTHSDERKYVCSTCTKAFKRQDHLNGHQLTHMNKKPYECEVEGCDKSYCDARSLRRHTENHHAAMVQAGADAAAAAAANAITIRMGTANVENETSNNSFLAAALQSNRICYAPPPNAVVARSSPTLPTLTNEGGGITSAATQLQLLAFQQSAAATQDSPSIVSTTSNASTWHQQQNVLFINSSIGRVNFGGESQSEGLKDGKESGEATGVSLEAQNKRSERIPSVLERHLKMGINPVKNTLRQENSTNDIISHTQPSIIQGLHTNPTSTQTLPIMAFQIKNQWLQHANFNSGLDFGTDPKPVECHVCHRRFRNIPALNGHMRLHGGYLKRDADSLKKSQNRKLDGNHSSLNTPTSSNSHSPLQTASINVRALIEEKIIQKRIINPPLPNINPSQPPTINSSLPPHLFLPLPPPLISSVNPLPPPTLEHHRPMDSSFMAFPEIMSSENVDELLFENSNQSVLPSSNLPPPPLPQTTQSNATSLMQNNSMEDAQTKMRRDIERIKKDLMSNQPPLEKFRRHSDSDHFLTPVRDIFTEVYNHSSPETFMDYMNQRMVSKRTQRACSDPGEFAVGDQLNDMFSGDLEIEDLTRGGDVTGGIPPSDMMDFEMVDTNNEGCSKNNSSLLAAAALCSTPPSTLMDVIDGISSPFNENLVIPESTGPGQSENSFKIMDVAEDDDVFLSPSSIPNSPSIIKKKHRPEPLQIPPQVSTGGYQSRLRSPRLWDPTLGGKAISPPPYTPPPMLSPVRKGPGLFWHVYSGSGSVTPKSAPITPGRFSGYTMSSIVNDTVPAVTEETTDSEPPPETDVRPHVNVGPNYQAALPPFRINRTEYDPYVEDLVWDPKTEEMLSDKQLDAYLRMSCCAATPGGGRNKEYALHMLHMAKGSIPDAMLKLMDPLPKLPKKHPLYSYSYQETAKWVSEEIETFHHALNYCDKDFYKIAREVKTKTVQQCVELYYLWKKICPEEYRRLRTSRKRKEVDKNYNLRSKLYGTDEVNDFEQSHTPKSDDRGSSPVTQVDLKNTSSTNKRKFQGQPGEIVGERFVCDHPECFSSFASRQALNGHIKIHGGNPTLSRIGGHQSKGNDDISVRPYSPSTNSVSNASKHYAEVVQEFPCKICGKVFYKVKSRNAHMKSHRPIDSDRLK